MGDKNWRAEREFRRLNEFEFLKMHVEHVLDVINATTYGSFIGWPANDYLLS